MALSLLVNIMSACFFLARHVYFCNPHRAAGVAGSGVREEPGIRAARISTRTHVIFGDALFSLEAARPRRQRVDSRCITHTEPPTNKLPSRVRNPGVKSGAGSGTRCTSKHFSSPLAAVAAAQRSTENWAQKEKE